jgi:hypothetical protein
MGKIMACSMGTGVLSTIRTTINTVKSSGKTSVGTKIPAR